MLEALLLLFLYQVFSESLKKIMLYIILTVSVLEKVIMA